ncbi:MAG: hypothetical protein A2147_07510 [Chloroflexi bacterium RBG_16_57_8]|nr:MAG: hypothetical protein A2147_07510 [Chloroflexi bacterium RBG_16_57_8]
MEWQFFVALIVAIPIILFPAAFVWYLNVGGLYHALRERLVRKAAQRTIAPEAGDADDISGLETRKPGMNTTNTTNTTDVKYYK